MVERTTNLLLCNLLSSEVAVARSERRWNKDDGYLCQPRQDARKNPEEFGGKFNLSLDD